MKRIELTVLARDVDRVIEYLGRRGIMHFAESPGDQGPEGGSGSGAPDSGGGRGFQDLGLRAGAPEPLTRPGGASDSPLAPPSGEESGLQQSDRVRSLDKASFRHIRNNLEKLRSGAAFLGIELPAEPEADTSLPGETEEVLTDKLHEGIAGLISREQETAQEKRKVEETLNEAQAFANLNAPFADLDQLSYLTLRVGRLDSKAQEQVKRSLVDRAVIIPLGEGGERILAAASRRGRFALDSELKKAGFIPIAIPEGYQGVPVELLGGLKDRLALAKAELEQVRRDKEELRQETAPQFRALTASYLMAAAVEQLKGKLTATRSIYILSGWTPQDTVRQMVEDLSKITEKRIAVRTFSPEEMPEVAEGREKVPVSLKHGAYVKGFEPVVFSYGAPLYGTIDPTPFVAFFFTILFGIMFGDLGQGFVLFSLGLLTRTKGPKALKGFHS
jgi:V/A-type H+-transporting ATPase subunit I